MNQTVLRRQDVANLTVVSSNPRAAVAPMKTHARRPVLRLVPAAPRARVSLQWGNRPLLHLVSAAPLLFAAYLLLQAEHVAWDQVFGAQLLGGVLLALLA